MAAAEIGKIEMLGQELIVYVSASDWKFTIRDQEDKILGKGETLQSAKGKARTELNKLRVEVAVPFKMDDGREGVGIARRAGSRSVRVVIDGQKDEIGGGGSFRYEVFKPDTPAEVLTRIRELAAEIKEREREFKTLTGEWTFNLGNAVDRAVEQRAEEVI